MTETVSQYPRRLTVMAALRHVAGQQRSSDGRTADTYIPRRRLLRGEPPSAWSCCHLPTQRASEGSGMATAARQQYDGSTNRPNCGLGRRECHLWLCA